MGVTKQPNLFKDTPIEELLNQVATMSDTMSDIVSTNFVPFSVKPNSVVLKVHDSIIEDPYNYWQCLKFARDFHLLDANISFEREHVKRTLLVGTQKTNPIISSADLQNKSHVVSMLSGISVITFTTLKRNAYESTQDPLHPRILRIWSSALLGVNGYSLSSSTFEKYLPWPRFSENMMFYFDVDPTEIKATYKESSYEIKIVGNDSVSIESNKDWCTVEPTSIQGNGTVTVKVTRNLEAFDRKAAITLKSKTQTKHVNVIQTYRVFRGVTVNGKYIDADLIPHFDPYDPNEYDTWNEELNNTFPYATSLGYFQGDIEIIVDVAEGVEYIALFRIFNENGNNQEGQEDYTGPATINYTFGSEVAGQSVGFYIEALGEGKSYPDVYPDDTYFICTFKVPGSTTPKLSLAIYGEYEYHSASDSYDIVYWKTNGSWLTRYAKEEWTAILVFGYYDLQNKTNPYTQSKLTGNPYVGSYTIEQKESSNQFYMFRGSSVPPEEGSIVPLLESCLKQSSVDSSKVELLTSPCIFFLPKGEGPITQDLTEVTPWYDPDHPEKTYTYRPSSDSFVYWQQGAAAWKPYTIGTTKVNLVYYEFPILSEDRSMLEAVTPNSLVPHFFNIEQGSVYDSVINTILKKHLSTLNDGLISQDNNVSLDVVIRDAQ